MYKHGQISVPELGQMLTGLGFGTARVALIRRDGEWFLWQAAIDFFPTQGHSPKSLDYGEAAFIQGQISGQSIAQWLATKSGSMLSYRFAIPGLSEPVMWVGQGSHMRYGPDAPEWPYAWYQVRPNDVSPTPSTMGLVGDGLPFYRDFEEAFWFNIHGLKRPDRPGGDYYKTAALIVRVADTDARLTEVELEPTGIRVTVDGNNVSAVQMNISFGPGDQAIWRVGRRKHFSRRFSGNLPEDIWVTLSRGTEWVDYVHIDAGRLGSDDDGAISEGFGSNVVVAPEIVGQSLAAMIARGEGPNVEFKELFGESALKSISAFANSEGGTILVGVNDEGAVTGVAEPRREADRIIDMVRKRITEPLPVTVDIHQADGRDVIAVCVPAGDNPPYAVGPTDHIYYVRRMATSVRAHPDEIRRMIDRSRTRSYRAF